MLFRRRLRFACGQQPRLGRAPAAAAECSGADGGRCALGRLRAQRRILQVQRRNSALLRRWLVQRQRERGRRSAGTACACPSTTAAAACAPAWRRRRRATPDPRCWPARWRSSPRLGWRTRPTCCSPAAPPAAGGAAPRGGGARRRAAVGRAAPTLGVVSFSGMFGLAAPSAATAAHLRAITSRVGRPAAAPRRRTGAAGRARRRSRRCRPTCPPLSSSRPSTGGSRTASSAPTRFPDTTCATARRASGQTASSSPGPCARPPWAEVHRRAARADRGAPARRRRRPPRDDRAAAAEVRRLRPRVPRPLPGDAERQLGAHQGRRRRARRRREKMVGGRRDGARPGLHRRLCGRLRAVLLGAAAVARPAAARRAADQGVGRRGEGREESEAAAARG